MKTRRPKRIRPARVELPGDAGALLAEDLLAALGELPPVAPAPLEMRRHPRADVGEAMAWGCFTRSASAMAAARARSRAFAARANRRPTGESRLHAHGPRHAIRLPGLEARARSAASGSRGPRIVSTMDETLGHRPARVDADRARRRGSRPPIARETSGRASEARAAGAGAKAERAGASTRDRIPIRSSTLPVTRESLVHVSARESCSAARR